MWIAAGDRARVVGCDVGSAAGALEAQAPCMSIRDERREGQCVQDMPLWYDRSSLGPTLFVVIGSNEPPLLPPLTTPPSPPTHEASDAFHLHLCTPEEASTAALQKGRVSADTPSQNGPSHPPNVHVHCHLLVLLACRSFAAASSFLAPFLRHRPFRGAALGGRPGARGRAWSPVNQQERQSRPV